jgi:hypothetical protein
MQQKDTAPYAVATPSQSKRGDAVSAADASQPRRLISEINQLLF